MTPWLWAKIVSTAFGVSRAQVRPPITQSDANAFSWKDLKSLKRVNGWKIAVCTWPSKISSNSSPGSLLTANADYQKCSGNCIRYHALSKDGQTCVLKPIRGHDCHISILKVKHAQLQQELFYLYPFCKRNRRPSIGRAWSLLIRHVSKLQRAYDSLIDSIYSTGRRGENSSNKRACSSNKRGPEVDIAKTISNGRNRLESKKLSFLHVDTHRDQAIHSIRRWASKSHCLSCARNEEVVRCLCLRAQQLRNLLKSWHQSTLLDDSTLLLVISTRHVGFRVYANALSFSSMMWIRILISSMCCQHNVLCEVEHGARPLQHPSLSLHRARMITLPTLESLRTSYQDQQAKSSKRYRDDQFLHSVIWSSICSVSSGKWFSQSFSTHLWAYATK